MWDQSPRRLGATLLMLAALPPTVGDPVRDVVDRLPPPVREPVREIVDRLPVIPLPTPAPTPTPPAAVTPAPALAPAPTRAPSAGATVTAPSVPVATPAARSQPQPTAPAAARTAEPNVPAARRERPATGPAGARPGARPGARQRAQAPRQVASRTPPVPAGPPSFGSGVTGTVGEIVRAVPRWLLWALALVALVALGLGVNAFRQARRRSALEAQRAELLDDIGLLQRALLPAMPDDLDGVAVTAAYRPADGPAAGGDFYDVFTLGEDRVCVLLGDVSGHGRESVTQAALARYTLRTLLADGHRPAEALARADTLLARDLQPNFVTVIAGVYEPSSGELTYAKAGHAPPIVLGTAHDPDAEEPAPPIGLGVGEGWPEYRVRLGEGVTVCLFTDGLQDAQVGDTRVGRAAVERMLAAHDIPDAGRLLGDLEGVADRVCDDTAAVVLSRQAP